MTSPRRALVIGVTGQDGSYLAEWLLARGYSVVGTSRSPVTVPETGGAFRAAQWDGVDKSRIQEIVADAQPHELYNLAARTTGVGMYDDAIGMGDLNGLSPVRILEAVRNASPQTRVLQASSSEVFGDPPFSPQNESTPRNPRSPYGAAKAYADAMVGTYRRRYGLFTCSAILFNHESPRRPASFVTRKVTSAVARIKSGLADEVTVGNLDAKRDWGFAGDFVRGMWMMLQAPSPRDYVLATGVAHSVRELCDVAFSHVGLDYRDHVRSDPDDYRPDEAVLLLGDATRARVDLGWCPSVDFRELITMMVDADLALAATASLGRNSA